MLKKLAAKLNPFKSAPPAPVVVQAAPAAPAVHVHSFSCPCEDCLAQTAELTRARLRRQGATR